MSDQFTQEQISGFREAFQMFDKNGNGSIDINELGDVLRSFGSNYSRDELKDMIKQDDADNNGNIDFQEFLAMMSRMNNQKITESDMIEEFKKFDKDGNGFIDRKELGSVWSQLDPTLTRAELDQAINEVDANGDGMIDYKEFVRMMS